MHWKRQELSTHTPKLNLLVAYPYMSQVKIDLIRQNSGVIRFLLDSGAFTAQQLGKKISLDEYCKFIESLPFEPWKYFTLDVIGNPEKTIRNYETMLARGFKPVPILTQGESFSVMDEFWKTSDVVGVGGLVDVPLKEKQRFIYKVMKHSNGRRVHWLGFTNDQFVKHFRPYMCDSSAFTGADRFGQLMIYQGNGRYKMLKKSEFSKKPDEADLRKIASWGFNPYELKSIRNWHGGEALSSKISARSYVEKSCDYEKNLSVKLFLAAAADLATINLVNAINKKIETERVLNV